MHWITRTQCVCSSWANFKDVSSTNRPMSLCKGGKYNMYTVPVLCGGSKQTFSMHGSGSSFTDKISRVFKTKKSSAWSVYFHIYISTYWSKHISRSIPLSTSANAKQTNKQTTTTTKKKKKVNHSNECMNTKEAFDTDQTANIKQVAIIIVIITLINQIYWDEWWHQ